MAKLKLPSYQDILNMTSSQVSKQLARLRPIASKRINKLMSAGKARYLKDIGKLNKVNNNMEELNELVRFLRKPFSQVSNINKFERDMYKTLRDHGYEIELEDVAEFNQFMAEIRAMYKGRRIPDSTRVAEAFIQAKRLKMSNKALKQNLDYWREHLDEMQQLADSKSKTKYSAKYIKQRIAKVAQRFL